MSNEEKLKRAKYRKFRNTMILVLAIISSFVFAGTLYSSITYYNLNKEEYVTYCEKANTNYLVYLKDNPFYEEEYLQKGQSYIASIIDSIEGEFEYRLLMDTTGVSFKYSYWIDAELEILDNTSGRVIYKPVDNLVDKKSYNIVSANCIYIKDKVSISYDEYNDFATEFVNAYNLENSTCNVLIKLHVEINESASHFSSDVNNSYVVSINVPLTKLTVNIDISSNIPSSTQKVLLIENIKLNNLYKNLTIILSIVEVVLIIGFVCFLYFTRNNDINYTIKIKKILNNYKSYIQRILNPFEYGAYRVIELASFNEMLDIRDTVRSPILMYENEDQTCSTFVIPTNTDLLYLFEIKVADYDEIYQQNKEDSSVLVEDSNFVTVNNEEKIDQELVDEESNQKEHKEEKNYVSKDELQQYLNEIINSLTIKEPTPQIVEVVKEVIVKEVPINTESKVEQKDLDDVRKENRTIKSIVKLEPKPQNKETIKYVKKVKSAKPKKVKSNQDLYSLVTRRTSLEGGSLLDDDYSKKKNK